MRNCSDPVRAGRSLHLISAALVPLAVAASLGACASSSSQPMSRTIVVAEPTMSDRSLLTQRQMRERDYATVFDAIEAMRGNWLRARGPISVVNSTPVLVYLDEMRLGDIETLRTLSPAAIAWARYYNGIEASSRWGVGHGQGVILLSSVTR